MPHHKPLSSASQSGFDGDPAARYRCFSSSSRPVLRGKQQEVPSKSQQVGSCRSSGGWAQPRVWRRHQELHAAWESQGGCMSASHTLLLYQGTHCVAMQLDSAFISCRQAQATERTRPLQQAA